MGARSERCRRLVRHTLRCDSGYPEPYRARLTPRSPIRGALWRQDYLAKAIGAKDDRGGRSLPRWTPAPEGGRSYPSSPAEARMMTSPRRFMFHRSPTADNTDTSFTTVALLSIGRVVGGCGRNCTIALSVNSLPPAWMRNSGCAANEQYVPATPLGRTQA
jgi:hypothetical protein